MAPCPFLTFAPASRLAFGEDGVRHGQAQCCDPLILGGPARSRNPARIAIRCWAMTLMCNILFESPGPPFQEAWVLWFVATPLEMFGFAFIFPLPRLSHLRRAGMWSLNAANCSGGARREAALGSFASLFDVLSSSLGVRSSPLMEGMFVCFLVCGS